MADNAARDERWYLPKYETVEEERQHRKQRLAAGFRLFGKFGFEEGVAGHITARDPERLDHFWVNPFGISFIHIKVTDLLLVDSDGTVVEGKGAVNTAAFAIHSTIHAARPDVVAAAHSHSVYGKAWSSLGRLLDPLTQDACAFYEDHALFDDFSGVVYGTDEAGALARALGDKKALLLQHHGLLTVGETVDEAAFWLHLLERCCEAQLLVASLAPNADGSAPYRALAPSIAAHTRAQVGEHLHGWMGFQPLCEEIVRADPDVLQ